MVLDHCEVRPKRPLRIIMTVNAAWNIWNFRKSLLEALISDGHDVNILAPYDEFAPLLEKLGCQVTIANNGLEAIEKWKQPDTKTLIHQIIFDQQNSAAEGRR